MKLGIFGATGTTGRHLVERALSAGHEVTALVRNPSVSGFESSRVRLVVGALDDQDAVQRTVAGQDAVISVLGVRKGGPTTVCTEGATSILKAMNATGVRRIVALSAHGASESRDASLFIRFVRSVIAEKMRDKDAMEAAIRASRFDWTLVRPPALTNGKPTGDYRFGAELKMGWSARISRSDVAGFILQHAISETSVRKVLTVAT
jgi:putative NADH-flavin reductase